MEHYARINVSLEFSSVCIVDAHGKIVKETKTTSSPRLLLAWGRFTDEKLGLPGSSFAKAF